MSLATGTKLGPYEVQSAIGAGGMGEVYKARDTRLDRTVAVKVLPPHLSSSPDLRARFEREAKAISGLQHPNICVLYDVGSQDGVDFLVMEYLEGETLYARLARKPLSADETLKIAAEVADALEKAHRSGIIHRDLKPGNIMLTKGGAKLMDFGLAKPLGLRGGPQSGSQHISSMATMAATVAEMASPVTVAGTMIGTMQYMSPEQIQGKEADARSDIFAFGATLYEMLTGKRAFSGKSQLSLASAILEKDPEPIATLVPLTPPALENVVRTCMAKEPDDRFQSAHDLKLQLQWIAAGGSLVGTPAVVTSHRKKTAKVLTAAMIAGWLIAAALGALALLYSNRLTTAQQPVHADIQLPSAYDISAVSGAPALSPDGQQIAVVGVKKGTVGASRDTTIFLRRVGEGEAQPLAGTQGGIFPFWSPDGKYLAFFADGKLKKIPLAGGAPQLLCNVPDGRGGSWNEQGTIVFAPRIEGPLQSVSDGGGTPVEVTAARKNETTFTDRNPYFLPDGKHFLYVHRGSDSIGRVYAASLAGGEPKEILPAGSNVALSNGYLFYMTQGTLTAQAFDPSSLSFKGKPVSIAANVEFYNPRNLGFFAVSRNVLLYRTAVNQNRVLAWFDLTGKEVDHWGDPAPYLGAYFFPVPQTVLLSRATPGSNGSSIWLSDIQRKTVNRITPDTEMYQSAVLSPDGKDIWIGATTGYLSSLSHKSLTASGAEDKIIEKYDGQFTVFSISHDGRYLLLNHQDPKTDYDIYMMDLRGDRKLVPLLNSPAAEIDGLVSPDGKWMAYQSTETGAVEVFVTSFPTPGARWQVSNGAGRGALDWSADGKNLRYLQGDKVFNVEVRDNGGKLEFSVPKELVTLPPNLNVISVLPDDKRILVLRTTGDDAIVPMDFVLNWQNLVK